MKCSLDDVEAIMLEDIAKNLSKNLNEKHFQKN